MIDIHDQSYAKAIKIANKQIKGLFPIGYSDKERIERTRNEVIRNEYQRMIGELNG